MTTAFQKIAGATMTGGGNNIRDGIYKFLVEKIIYQKGHSGECFIAELRVMESAADGSVDEQGKPVVPHAVGSTCSLVCNLTQHESAASNAKKFAFGCLAGLGYTEDKITEDLMMKICGPTNPLRGVTVCDSTYRGVNQGKKNPTNRGKPLTLHNWKPVSQNAEAVKAGREYLDSNAARADNQPAAAQVAAPDPVVPSATAPTATAAPAPNAAPDILAGLGIK